MGTAVAARRILPAGPDSGYHGGTGAGARTDGPSALDPRYNHDSEPLLQIWVMAELEPVHPGEILKHDFMDPWGLSATALSTALGMSPERINEIVEGVVHRCIDPDVHCIGPERFVLFFVSVFRPGDAQVRDVGNGRRRLGIRCVLHEGILSSLHGRPIRLRSFCLVVCVSAPYGMRVGTGSVCIDAEPNRHSHTSDEITDDFQSLATIFAISFLAGFSTEQVVERLRKASKALFGEEEMTRKSDQQHQ